MTTVAPPSKSSPSRHATYRSGGLGLGGGRRANGRGGGSGGRGGGGNGGGGGGGNENGRGRHGLKPLRRWPKRALIAAASLVLLLVLLAAGGYFYVNYRIGQVKTQTCSKCVAAAPGQPFTVLLIGSDSRAFVDDGNQTQVDQYGSAANQGGQRSDVTIVARVVPATHQILMMSIPRDLWVNIPGDVADISGPNRINAAFNNGPSLLAQTISQDLGIQVNDFAEVNFPGFQGMVSALGGIYLDFPDPVKDAFSGLNITKTGCQLVSGTQSLALVRSRHLFYYKNGQWNADVQSDFSRIQRQDVFFRAVIGRVHAKDLDPLSLNAFIGGVVGDITVNPALKGQLLGLAEALHSIGGNALKTETLPTTEFTNQYGEDVLEAAQPYANNMVKAFNSFGANSTSTSKPSSGSTTTTIPKSSIHIDVLNGNGISGAASGAAGDLTRGGYVVTGTGNASTFSFNSTQIQYAPGHQAVAQQLASAISGSTQLLQDASLTGDNVILTVGSNFSGLVGSSSSSSSTSSTSTSSPPPNVVTNTQTEPWNPTVC